jgi:hypothetical protein
MPDSGHHGEGEHHQGDVTVPAMPGSALVVIEPELVFRGFKAVLDRPSDGLRPRPAFQLMFPLGTKW